MTNIIRRPSRYVFPLSAPCPTCAGRKEIEVAHGVGTVHIVCTTCIGEGIVVRKETGDA
jgi:DnaJ-class molecular chaperone